MRRRRGVQHGADGRAPGDDNGVVSMQSRGLGDRLCPQWLHSDGANDGACRMNRHIEYFLRRVHRDESGAVAVLVEI